jgi:tRNA uridine 5-carboxymethylaminomethyl modification enzyme
MGEAAITHEYSLHELLKRPGLDSAKVAQFKGEPVADPQVAEQVEIQAKYDGYIARQLEEIEQSRRYESTKLPIDLDYDAIGGLSNEVKQKLRTLQPETLGVASRLSGITPAAISQILIHLKKRNMATKMSA